MLSVTRDQLAAVVSAANESGSSPNSLPPNEATDTPPVIQINGDNPAIIQVGDSYADLGATITGPQVDLNLGITTYVNDVEMSPVQIDTSTAATDTIDYVVTDSQGLTATSTRTVIIEAPSILPTDDALAPSTTCASTTAPSPRRKFSSSTSSANNPPSPRTGCEQLLTQLLFFGVQNAETNLALAAHAETWG